MRWSEPVRVRRSLGPGGAPQRRRAVSAGRAALPPSFLPSLLPSVLRALGSARLPLRGLCGRPGTRGGRLRGRGGAGSSDGMAAGRGGAGGSERRGAVRRLAPSRGGRRCGSARSVAAAAAPCGAVSLPGRWVIGERRYAPPPEGCREGKRDGAVLAACERCDPSAVICK